MMIEKIVYFLKRTRENVLLHPFASGVTLMALTLCLLFLGISFFLFRNITTMMPLWMTSSKAVVYFHARISSQDQENLAEELKQWPRIQEVRIISKEDARKQMEAQLGDWKGILDSLQENPLPASLEISFKAVEKHPEEIEALVGKLREFPQVEDVFYGKSSMEKLEFLPVLAKLFGSWAPGLLALIVVLIASNSVKHTLSARREELEIYDIVGATPFFTRAPIYLEGMIQGIVSGFVASGVLLLGIIGFRKALPPPLGAVFAWDPWELFCLTAGTMLCGAALSWLGSWLALRKLSAPNG